MTDRVLAQAEMVREAQDIGRSGIFLGIAGLSLESLFLLLDHGKSALGIIGRSARILITPLRDRWAGRE